MKTKVLKKILLIFSQGLYDLEKIKQLIEHLNTSVLEFDYIINPSYHEFEMLIYKNDYLCVIPFTQCLSNSRKEFPIYNIIQFLENLEMTFFGCGYISNIMLYDKLAFIKSTQLGLPTKTITSCNSGNILNENYFPAKINPNCNEPVFFQIARSNEEAQKIIKKIFNENPEIKELVIQKELEYQCEIKVTIIGNPPYSLEYIHLSDNVDNLGESLILKIKEKSYEIFNKFSFRDYAQFKYVVNLFENDFYLTDVDITNFFDSDIIIGLKNKFSIKYFDIIYLYTYICLSRRDEKNISSKYINEIINLFPVNVMNYVLPLNYKLDNGLQYSYQDICRELEKRFLKPDESNKYEITSLFNDALTCIPSLRYKYGAFLGKEKNDYSFLQKYEKIPSYPQNPSKILNESLKILDGQLRWHSPSVLHNVNTPTMFSAIVASSIVDLYNPNAMQSEKSAGILKMEKQIVRQCSKLIGWDCDNSGGVFTTGGKSCLAYAVKCGITRCQLQDDEYKKAVVITSESNHYSIESVCNQLGLSPKACIRIPVNNEGTINFDFFEKVIKENIDNNIPIACIIFSGGNTTHCNVENIEQGCQIIDKIVTEKNLQYKPFIYYDLVVGWPWLFYKEYDFTENCLAIPHSTLKKIEGVIEKVNYSHLADAIGIDFHKGGFSPYTSSLFLIKQRLDLYNLSIDNVDVEKIEPYHYTFNNSRMATKIVSVWNILQSVGIKGFQSYVANMLTVTNIFAKILSDYNFEIIEGNNTYGFATIIWTNSPKCTADFNSISNSEDINENNKYLFNFSQYLLTNSSQQFSIRFLPRYKLISEKVYIAALSLLPMTLNLNLANTPIFATKIGHLKYEFDKKYINNTFCPDSDMPENVPK